VAAYWFLAGCVGIEPPNIRIDGAGQSARNQAPPRRELHIRTLEAGRSPRCGEANWASTGWRRDGAARGIHPPIEIDTALIVGRCDIDIREALSLNVDGQEHAIVGYGGKQG